MSIRHIIATLKGATPMSRHTVLAVALGVVVAATAACSSGSGTSTPAPTTAPASTPTATPTSAATPTATATPAATSGATHGAPGVASGEPNPATSRSANSPCLESALRASVDPRHIPGNGTAGSDGRHLHGVLIDFANTSKSTCTLYGYPGAAIENSANQQVQQARRTLRGALGGLPSDQNSPLRVSLKPGASAAALIEGIDTRLPGTAQAGCDGPPNPRILVTPPNTDTAVPFAVGWPQCYTFDVHPVRS